MKYPRQPRRFEKVKVYRNLNNGKISVMGRNPHGRFSVIAHLDSVCLISATFKVNEAGRQRVIKEKRKNVHAFVEGLFLRGDFEITPHKYHKVTYNPYKYSTFVYMESEKPIETARRVLINANGKILIP